MGKVKEMAVRDELSYNMHFAKANHRRRLIVLGIAVTLGASACSSNAGVGGNVTTSTSEPPAVSSATLPEPTATSASLQVPTADFSGTFSAKDEVGYSYSVSFSGTLTEPTVNTADQRPGRAYVLAGDPEFAGSITNTTPNRNLDVPGLTLIGYWPSTSLVCSSGWPSAAQTAGAVDTTSPTSRRTEYERQFAGGERIPERVQPVRASSGSEAPTSSANDWCIVSLIHATGGQPISAGSISVGETRALVPQRYPGPGMAGNGEDVEHLDGIIPEGDVAALTAALATPTASAIMGGSKYRSTYSIDPQCPGINPTDQTERVLWSSTTLVCAS